MIYKSIHKLTCILTTATIQIISYSHSIVPVFIFVVYQRIQSLLKILCSNFVVEHFKASAQHQSAQHLLKKTVKVIYRNVYKAMPTDLSLKQK